MGGLPAVGSEATGITAKDQPQCVWWGFPRPLCGFDDSQRTSRMWHAVRFVAAIYFSERRKSKISKGEDA